MDLETENQIRIRAYEIWESEGCPEGRDGEHWTRAMEEMKPAAAPVAATSAKAPKKAAAAKSASTKAAPKARSKAARLSVTLN